MNLLEMVLNEKNGALVSQLGGNFGLSDALTSFLDADRDGSALDDVLGMAKKLF